MVRLINKANIQKMKTHETEREATARIITFMFFNFNEPSDLHRTAP